MENLSGRVQQSDFSKKITSHAKQFVADDKAATAIEYGLIAALLGIFAITSLTSLGSEIVRLFGVVETKVKTSME